MRINIQAKGMVVTPAISERIYKKVGKMERYLPSDCEMQIRLRREKNNRRICEITIPINGVTLRAEADNTDNMFLSIDQCLTRLEKQIHRHRTKLEKRLRDDAFKAPELEYIEEEQPEDVGKIVRSKTFPARPMSVEDAILNMELLEHSFYVFVNSETERTNVVYARKDGGYGLLEPEA